MTLYKSRHPEAVVIMVTANVLVEHTIAALRGGAYDFVAKPPNLDELRIRIGNGIEAHQLRREVGQMRRARAREFSFEQAEGGALFLDEIGELELGLQAKLLRVLEEESFRRVEPRLKGRGRGRALPHRPLLPSVGHPDRHPAAQGARR